MKFEIKTEIKDNIITQKLFKIEENVYEKIYVWATKIRDNDVKNALIKLGWTPPSEYKVNLDYDPLYMAAKGKAIGEKPSVNLDISQNQFRPVKTKFRPYEAGFFWATRKYKDDIIINIYGNPPTIEWDAWDRHRNILLKGTGTPPFALGLKIEREITIDKRDHKGPTEGWF